MKMPKPPGDPQHRRDEHQLSYLDANIEEQQRDWDF
jgi:hypothetical protein